MRNLYKKLFYLSQNDSINCFIVSRDCRLSWQQQHVSLGISIFIYNEIHYELGLDKAKVLTLKSGLISRLVLPSKAHYHLSNTLWKSSLHPYSRLMFLVLFKFKRFLSFICRGLSISRRCHFFCARHKKWRNFKGQLLISRKKGTYTERGLCVNFCELSR